jgi:hypothetical protein
MSMVDIPFPAVQSMGTVANRRAAGKALRKKGSPFQPCRVVTGC